MTKSTLQYQAPEFDKIKDEHFKPAFDYGLKQNISEIEKIANNTETPTFENTVLALEKSGEVLKRCTQIFLGICRAQFIARKRTLSRRQYLSSK
jgi:peptidyl-dipeptidase Dcp